MAKWYAVPTTARMTRSEYRANVTGLNVVFGAVLGFVLAGAGDLSTSDFVYLLLLSAAAVVTILYLGSSDYKLFYAAMAIVIAATLPWLLKQAGVPNLPKLQPTLGTWIAMVIFLELLPQEKDGESEASQQPDG